MALTDHSTDRVRILVTSLHDSHVSRAVAVRLVSILTAHGRPVELLDPAGRQRVMGNGLAPGRRAVEVLTSPRLLDDPETWVVARRADVVLLVVRLGKLRRSELDLAVRGLMFAQGPVVGWVTCRAGEPTEALLPPSFGSPTFTSHLTAGPGEAARADTRPQDTGPGQAEPS